MKSELSVLRVSIIRGRAVFSLLLGLAAFTLLFSTRSAAAASIVWNGGGATNNWTEGANWTGGSPPAAGDLALFNATSGKNASIDISISVGAIQIDAGYTGTVTQTAGTSINLSSSAACGGAAAYCQNGGSFKLTSGSLVLSGAFLQTAGSFSAGTSTVTVNDNALVTGTALFSGGTNTLHFNQRLDLGTTGADPAAFTSTSGTLFINGGSTIQTGVTFNHNNGTVILTGPFFGNTLSISNNAPVTFNNLTFSVNDGNLVSLSNAPLTILGNLALTDGMINSGILQLPTPATFDISPTFDGVANGTTLLLTGAGVRTATLNGALNIPNIHLNAPNTIMNTTSSATVTLPSLTLDSGTIDQGGADIFISGNYIQTGGTFSGSNRVITFNTGFTQTAGTFNGGSGDIHIGTSSSAQFGLSGTANFKSTSGTLTLTDQFQEMSNTVTFAHNNGLVNFTGPLFFNPSSISLKSGGETFNNVSFNGVGDRGWSIGNTMIVQGNLVLGDGSLVGGTLSPQGNMTVASTFDPPSGGTPTAVSFTGSAYQTFTNNGGANPGNTWTLNKPAGRVTLGSNLILNGGQALNILSGTLDLGASFNLQTSNTLTIGAAGILRDFGTGDMVLGGSVVNNGRVNINGGGPACTDPNGVDQLLISSTSAGTLRSWSGSGTFSVVDSGVTDQDATAVAGGIPVFGSSTISNSANWIASAGCPVFISPNSATVAAGAKKNFTSGGGTAPVVFSIAVNQSGGTIDPSTGAYTAGPISNVTDMVRVTDGLGATADAAVAVMGPTAAEVSVSGRVMTPERRGLRNAIVTLTDASGIERIARTNAFGYFSFADIPSGRSYVMTVESTHYTFATRVLEITDTLKVDDLIGLD